MFYVCCVYVCTVAAKIASFSQSIDVAWKRDVALLCDAVGVPEPSVQWQFNGNYIEMGSRRNVSCGLTPILFSLFLFIHGWK